MSANWNLSTLTLTLSVSGQAGASSGPLDVEAARELLRNLDLDDLVMKKCEPGSITLSLKRKPLPPPPPPRVPLNVSKEFYSIDIFDGLPNVSSAKASKAISTHFLPKWVEKIGQEPLRTELFFKDDVLYLCQLHFPTETAADEAIFRLNDKSIYIELTKKDYLTKARVSSDFHRFCVSGWNTVTNEINVFHGSEPLMSSQIDPDTVVDVDISENDAPNTNATRLGCVRRLLAVLPFEELASNWVSVRVMVNPNAKSIVQSVHLHFQSNADACLAIKAIKTQRVPLADLWESPPSDIEGILVASLLSSAVSDSHWTAP